MDVERKIKKCKVCGDRATGFNYRTLSCEPCKVFFFRNARKSLDNLKCRKENNCPIDETQRKSCTKCRLDKCFAVGMTLKNSETKSNQAIKSMIENVVNIRTLLESDFTTPSKIQSTYESETLNIFQSKLFHRKKNYAADLNAIERQMIAEVQNAMSVFEEETSLPLAGEVNNFVDIMNLPAHYIKRMVKFSKRISSFNVISDDDKLIILKPFFMELLSIRFIFSYSVELDGYTILQNEAGTHALFIKIDSFMPIHDAESFKMNKDLCIELQKEMEGDTTLRDLIIMQYLFRHRENLASPEYIRYNFYIYGRLLRRFLEHKLKSINKANVKYTKLVRQLETLGNVNKKNVKRLFAQFDITVLSDILVEIYGSYDK